MAETPYTLKTSQTFRRTNKSGHEYTMRIGAGTVVRREESETATEWVDTFRYTHDGYKWEAVLRRAKPTGVQVVSHGTAIHSNGNGTHVEETPSAPPPQSQAAQATAEVVAGAVATMVEKKIVHIDDEKVDPEMRAILAAQVRVRRLNRERKILSGRVFQVNYYHPTRLKIRTPAPIFRRHGFHLDGSNWVFSEEGLNHPEVQAEFKAWDAMKAIEEPSALGTKYKRRTKPEHWEMEYTKEQIAGMREKVTAALYQELLQANESLLANIEKAGKDLAKAQAKLGEFASPKELDKLENSYNGKLRSYIKDACDLYEMSLRGAEIFDDRKDDEPTSLDEVFEATRCAIRSRALAVNALMEAKRLKKVAVPASVMNPVPVSMQNPQPC